MARFEIPLYDRTEEIELPDAWQVSYATIANAPTLGGDEMRKALANPTGAERLSSLARGKGNVVIVVDDNTRPTPAWQFLPHVIEELHAGGVEDHQITILAGLALHRPMTLPEFRRKVGQSVVDTYQCINPSPWEDLVYLGDTEAGIPVKMNSDYVNADLRISCGGIIPHPTAGFGGGAKLTMPGVSSYETITSHHLSDQFDDNAERGIVDGNAHRQEIENIAAFCPPDFVVNPVLNREMNVAGLFCGHYVRAHRAGVELARKLYAVDAPPNADMAVISAAPQDSEMMQALKALADGFGAIHSVRSNGVVLCAADAVEGYGYHQMREHSRRTEGPKRRARPRYYLDRQMLCYSPNMSPVEFKEEAPEGFELFRDLADAIEVLESQSNGRSPVVNIFPQGAVSLYSAP